MPNLPNKITIDLRKGAEPVIVDGQPFPWHISAEDSLDVQLFDTGKGLPSVRLTLMADNVEVIPADPEDDQ
ncbi:hypothetical protein [Sinomonas soli]